MAADIDAAALLDLSRGLAARRAATRGRPRKRRWPSSTATESAQRVIDAAVQLHGGLGVTHGHIVERLYRDIRALRIYEGATEVQRLIIGREMLEGRFDGTMQR